MPKTTLLATPATPSKKRKPNVKNEKISGHHITTDGMSQGFMN